MYREENLIHETGVKPSYITVTWLLASGLAQGSSPALLTSRSFSSSRWASWIGYGMQASVSVQAKPNIRPWSPAPSLSTTPWSMSGDWECILIL